MNNIGLGEVLLAAIFVLLLVAAISPTIGF